MKDLDTVRSEISLEHQDFSAISQAYAQKGTILRLKDLFSFLVFFISAIQEYSQILMIPTFKKLAIYLKQR